MAKKKKILYVITKSNFGGAQRYVYDLARHIPKSEFEVKVALGGTGEKHGKMGTLEEKLQAVSIPVIPITHFMRDMSPYEDVQAFFELLRIVKKEKPNVLHVTSSKAGGIGAVIGRITRTPHIIFTSHGLAFDESWRPKWQRVLIWLASWCTFFFATQTIQITKDTYNRARSMPLMKNKHTLIHNGREAFVFFTRNEARSKLADTKNASPQKDIWIGVLSELTKNKNLHVLIDAMALIHKNGHSPHLYVCGEGEERDSLEKRIAEESLEEYIHLKGYIPNAANYLTAFDIFTLPSSKEGLPYVLIEAGFAALPVVASNIPGIKDIVTHHKTGLLVPITSEHLANAFITLLEDKSLREKYGQNLHAHVKKTFSVSHMVEQTVALYVESNPSSSLSSFSRRTDRS